MSQGVDLVTSLQGQVIATALVKKKPASRLSVYCQSVHVASILSTHVMNQILTIVFGETLSSPAVCRCMSVKICVTQRETTATVS
ncbi:hypothetical protein C0Q70_20723 [Pomacea canaliculata]|uniref:Uncharacterized protein n=1 Tax=Pomacea canaliculata TaxID=400727 RepID=A0A2T7NGB8_POMCA|nr:hypothetical protein C0Q70_20723 [Pomacea canaliculata]